MSLPSKLSIHGQKTTLTQTLIILDGEIIQISPIRIPPSCSPMTLNPLASKINLLTTHLLTLRNPNLAWKVPWNAS